MKKFFKILWKGLLFSVCVVVLVVGLLLIREWRQDQNQYYTSQNLSENVDVRWYYEEDEYRIYSIVEHKVVEKGIDMVVSPSDGDSLTVFYRRGLRGYLNANTGKVVIPAQYRHAWIFSEGLAAVVDESNKVGFINKNNEVVLPFVHSYNPDKPVDFLFYGGFCAMLDDEEMCGLIDTSGNWVLEPKYDYIWPPHHSKYRMVKLNGKYGVLDDNLNVIFPVVYDRIEIADHESDGLLLTRDGVKQQVAFDGTVLNPFVFDGCLSLRYVTQIAPIVVHDEDGETSLISQNSVLSDYLTYVIDGNEGVMHRETGEVIIPAIYEGIEMVSPTLFFAELNDVDGGILFDLNGRRVESRTRLVFAPLTFVY